MVDAIDFLAQHATRPSIDDYRSDPLLRFAAIKQIEIIGEAAYFLTKELRAAHPEVPWSQVIGMRLRLVHDYYSIDLDFVFDVIHKHAPVLRPQLLDILPELPPLDDRETDPTSTAD